VTKPKYTEITDAASLFEAFDSADDNGPPIPFIGHYRKFEEMSTSETIAAETVADEEGAPVPSVLSADGSVTQKISPVKAAKGAKLEQSASRLVQREGLQSLTPLPGEVSGHMNQDQGIRNKEILQQSSVMQTAVNINYGMQSSPHITQQTSNLPTSVTEGLSQSSPNESVLREEENENIILIPEAFIVEENIPGDVQIAEVAELVEPDPSRVSLKKRHACVFLVVIAAIVISLAIGLSVKFLNSDVTSILESTGTSQSENRSFSPSSQPAIVQQSSQPSMQTSSLSMRDDIQMNVLERNATFDGNRGLALDWIMYTDELQLDVSSSNLHQRYILALLSFEFGIPGWWLPESTSECEWYGVGCSINGTVLKLELGKCMFRLAGSDLFILLTHCVTIIAF
jgi:hypothetical protein